MPTRPRPRSRLLAAAAAVLAAAALLTGCSPDDTGTAPVASVAGSHDLRPVCPATVVVQTSWFPESTHGGLYQLLGAHPTVDKKHLSVRGPLLAGGAATGVNLEIRAGGPALGQTPVSALMALDHSITLGQQSTEEQVLGWAERQPTVGVYASFQRDPVVYIWDKTRHPTWNTIVDIGLSGVTVYTFRSALADALIGAGQLRAGQMNYSYDGSPSWFMADRGAVVGGFATNELYIYRNLKVDVGYVYAGAQNYRNTITVRRDAVDGLTPCLERLVPILQQGMIDFVAGPEATLKLIVDLDQAYASTYRYPIEQARYGVRTMTGEDLVGDGPVTAAGPGFHGQFDPSRLAVTIHDLAGVYAARRQPVPADLTAATIATDRFLNPHIRIHG